MYDDWKIDEPNLWAGGISDPIYVRGTGQNHTGNTSGEYIRFVGSRSTLHANGGNDRIDVNGNNLVAYGDGGNDLIATYHGGGSYSKLYGGKGNDTLYADTEGVYADGGADDDTFYIINSASEVTCDGGDGDDLFWFIRSSSEISLEGGNGSNTYRFDPYYLGGPYHNDVIITDFTSDDIIEYFASYGYGNKGQSDGSELDYYYDSDGNLVLYDANWDFFKITLEGITQENVGEIVSAKYLSTKKNSTLGEILGIEPDDGKVIVNAAGTAATITSDYTEKIFKTADYGTKIKTIDASETSQGIYITANGLANKIIGGAGADTLYAAKGNDTLTGGAGNDVFIYKSGDGKDVITDYAAGDKISLNTAYSDVTLSGSNVVFTIGKGTLTLQKAKGKTLTLIDSKGKESTTVVGGSTTLTLNNASDSTVRIDSAIEKVDATSRTKNIKIVGNALNNSISGGTKNDVLYGGAGKDTLKGNKGNDKLYGQSGADKLYGGAGNDTLWGGAGNDLLWGNSDKDIFVYKPGEGTDKIMDYWYDDGDMLKILKADGSDGGTFKSATFDGDTLTLAISGGGSVVFEDVSAGDKIKINSKTYTIKGRGLK